MNESIPGCSNIKFIRSDVYRLLHGHIQECSIDLVCLFFPDPWPNKDRDVSRRIIRPEIIDLLSLAVKNKGVLKIVTDVSDYAEYSQDIMKTYCDRGWRLMNSTKYKPRERVTDNWRPITKYEVKAESLGHDIWDLEYVFEK